MGFSRDLMNDTPKDLNPTTFPKRLQDELAGTAANVKIFDKAKLEEMELNGLLTVGQGSEHEPALVEISYQGDASKPLVALVGKGVTYEDRKSTRLNSSHVAISYAVFCLKKKNNHKDN